MVTLEVGEAKGVLNKTIGLIGAKNRRALFFKTRFGIHTFGLKLPIDVLILDKNDRVVYLRERLLPNRLFFWNPRFNKVVELPAGTARNHRLALNDKIRLVICKK